MRELAQEWLAKEMRKARIAFGRAEERPGVTTEELKNLQNKVDSIDWLLCQFGESKFSDDCTACAYDFTGERSCVSYIHHLESRLAQVERERNAALKDIANTCWSCANAKPHQISKFLYSCPYLKGKAGVRTQCEHWQWRGVCEENTKEE